MNKSAEEICGSGTSPAVSEAPLSPTPLLPDSAPKAAPHRRFSPMPCPAASASGLLSLLVFLALASGGTLLWQLFHPERWSFYALTVDRLSAALAFLVATISAATYRFSLRYLAGEPRQMQFLHSLFVTAAAAYVLMLASNLLLLFGAWALMSFSLHRLLTFYPERPEGQAAARKKFLISRLGDLTLLLALGLMGGYWGTFDILAALRLAEAGANPAVARAIAILVVLAALTKSAQFPFHSWLPETMEAPTPVSALMHAGVVNAGGVLLLRFAPLLVLFPEALLLLSLVGTTTATLGLLSMWAQVKVKRQLAWSTVSQMGFMMVQCGLGAFPAALLHILGHGFYKAWSFLGTGEVGESRASTRWTSPYRTLTFVAIGGVVAAPEFLWTAERFGVPLLRSPGESALLIISCLSVGQLWVVWLADPPRPGEKLLRFLAGFVGTWFVVAGFVALYAGANSFLQPVHGALPHASGPIAWCAAALPVLACGILIVFHAFLPVLTRGAAGRAFRIYALHGFYFGAWADLLVRKVWQLSIKRN